MKRSILSMLAAILVVESAATAQSPRDLSNRQLIAKAPPAGWVPEWVPELGRPETSEIGDELARRARAGLLTPEEWRDLFESQQILRTRPTWPKGSAIEVGLVLPNWMSTGLEVRVKAPLEGAVPVRAGRTWEPLCGLVGNEMLSREPKEKLHERHGSTGISADEQASISMDVEVRSGGEERFSSKYWHEAAPVFAGTLMRKVRIVASMEEATQPVKDQESDADVRSCLNVIVHGHRWADSSIHAGISVGIDRRSEPSVKKLGLGLVIEIVRDQEIIETISMPDASMWAWAPHQWQASQEELPRFAGHVEKLVDPKERSLWKVRVKGDAGLSLSAWDCDRHWAGDFSIPLDQVFR